MNRTHRETWECYTAGWRAPTREEKLAACRECLDENCVYTDPLVVARGIEELVSYMVQFHEQVPGGHFVVTAFQEHHDRSIVHWELRSGSETKLGDGISYGEYGPDGRLRAMTGFFATGEPQ